MIHILLVVIVGFIIIHFTVEIMSSIIRSFMAFCRIIFLIIAAMIIVGMILEPTITAAIVRQIIIAIIYIIRVIITATQVVSGGETYSI